MTGLFLIVKHTTIRYLKTIYDLIITMNSLEYYIKFLNLNKLLKIGRINFNDSHI